MANPKKPMVWKEEDGQKYKISFSEELQMRNLQATRELTMWQKRHFYAKIVLILLFGFALAGAFYVMYNLDRIDFFSRIIGWK